MPRIRCKTQPKLKFVEEPPRPQSTQHQCPRPGLANRELWSSHIHQVRSLTYLGCVSLSAIRSLTLIHTCCSITNYTFFSPHIHFITFIPISTIPLHAIPPLLTRPGTHLPRLLLHGRIVHTTAGIPSVKRPTGFQRVIDRQHGRRRDRGRKSENSICQNKGAKIQTR